MSDQVENRQYQDEAVDKSLNELAVADRAQIHMACGTGKSYVQAKTLKAFLEQREASQDDPPIIHVFVPNLGLVRQMEKSYRTILGDDIEYLGVGTKKESEAEGAARGFIMPMTTSEATIRDAIGERRKPLVVFSTYQSSPTLGAAMLDEDNNKLGATLTFMDEAHRTAGEKSQQSPFAFPLYDDNIKSNKRLFYTATPNVTEFDDKHKPELHSMDNDALYGKAVFDYPYSRAVKEGVVSPFHIQAPLITKGEIQAYRELKSLEHAEENAVIAELALLKVIEQTGQNKILTFHNSIAKSEAFADRLSNTLGNDGYHIKHIDGSHSAGERADAFDEMAAGPTVITSVRALGEGADSPGIQALLFADPRSSVREVIQNIGRIQRKDPGNPDKVGSIICPIVIDENSRKSPEEQILNSNYKTIFRVTEALRASSDVAGLQTKQASREFGRTDMLPEQDTAGIEFIDNTVLPPEKMESLLKAMRLATFQEMSDPFEVNLGRMEKFIEDHGRFPGNGSGYRDPEDKHYLSHWLENSKRKAEDGLLNRDDREQVEALQRLQVEYAQTSTEQNLFQLESRDHPSIRRKYDLEEIKNMMPHVGTWLDKVRTEHANGTLPLDDIERCEALSFFTWCDESTDLETAAQHRARFIERHGRPPTSEGNVAGASEASITVPFEIEAARLADQEADARDEQEKSFTAISLEQAEQTNLFSDPDLYERHIRGETTRAEEAALSTQDTLRFPEGLSREDMTFKALETFWEEYQRPPTAEGKFAGRTEILLASELKEAESAYVQAYFENGKLPSDKEDPFARLAPSQRQIAQSRAFMQSPSDDENLVRGRFQPARSGNGWEFIAQEPETAGTKTNLFNTGHKAPFAVIKMSLTDEQETQVKALGPRHGVQIDLQRAGKAAEPHKDGALGRIKSGWVERRDESFFDFVIARYKDRAAAGKPAYTMDNMEKGLISPREHITNLTPAQLREGKSYLQVPVRAFMKQTDMIRESSFERRHNRHMHAQLERCPGFAWYEHNGDAQGFDKTVEFFSNPRAARLLGDASAREGDNGLANTLRQLDKTVLEFKKAEKVPEAVRKVMTQHKNEYRAITLAARAIQSENAKASEERQLAHVRTVAQPPQGGTGQEELVQ